MAHLTREQFAALRAAVAPQLGYLIRARERLERIGFPTTDPVYRRLLTAQHALQDFLTELHYRSCAGG